MRFLRDHHRGYFLFWDLLELWESASRFSSAR
jgi:hypothetical protein